MIALLIVAGLMAATLLAGLLTVTTSGWWLAAVAFFGVVLLVAVWDVVQRNHSILRNYPVIGHVRFAMEAIRPEVQQYFIERDEDGAPFDRDIRSIVYERAKGVHGVKAFGTEQDVGAVGHEFLLHSVRPAPQVEDPPRVRVGGAACSRPYDMALLNVSG